MHSYWMTVFFPQAPGTTTSTKPASGNRPFLLVHVLCCRTEAKTQLTLFLSESNLFPPKSYGAKGTSLLNQAVKWPLALGQANIDRDGILGEPFGARKGAQLEFVATPRLVLILRLYLCPLLSSTCESFSGDIFSISSSPDSSKCPNGVWHFSCHMLTELLFKSRLRGGCPVATCSQARLCIIME